MASSDPAGDGTGYGGDMLAPVIPIFPLTGAILLPRGHLPLNIFEPRYLAMVRAAMTGPRLIGMVQPRTGHEGTAKPPIYDIGCVGRIVQFEETADGRFLIELEGVSRFAIAQELSATTPYRQVRADYSRHEADRLPPAALPATLRAALIDSLRQYLAAIQMEAEWDAIGAVDDESLVTSLVVSCPFEPAEKQVLLEALSLEERARTLDMLLQFNNASGDDDVSVH